MSLSLEALGAIGGAAAGYEKGVMQEIEQARQERLAKVRGNIQGENQQASDERRAKSQMELEDKRQAGQISLQQMRDAETRRKEEREAGRYEDIMGGKDGKQVIAQRDSLSGRYVGIGQAPGTSRGSAKSPEKIRLYEALRPIVGDEKAEQLAFYTGNKSREAFRQEVLSDMQKSGMYDMTDPDDQAQVEQEVNTLVQMAYPEQQQSAPAAGGAPRSLSEAVDLVLQDPNNPFKGDRAAAEQWIRSKYPQLK